MSTLQRLTRKIAISGTCWEYQGAVRADGYGAFWMEGKTIPAHRAAYLLHVGPIPAGLVLDHLCRNRRCINPQHLEAVTSQVNTIRGETAPAANLAKQHCPSGHPYSGANVRVTPEGRRVCRECHRRNARNSRNRRKAA